MTKVYYAILFVMVMVLAGCDSQPPELKIAIQEYFDNFGRNENSFSITSFQKATIPSHFVVRGDEMWCVTISSQPNTEIRNFTVSRTGLNWFANPAMEFYFLDLSCTNYDG